MTINIDGTLQLDDKSEERMSKYWICWSCAGSKQWKLHKDAVVTCTSGLCGHCHREDETTLIPVVDFYGPDKKAIWD